MSFLLNPFVFAAAGGDFESIATVNVGSGGTSSITFSSIGTDWTHLQLRILWTASTGSELQIAFNGNTTNGDYYRHQLYGSGSSAVAGANQLRTFASYTEVNANIFTGCVLDILDYANTSKNTTARSFWGFDSNGGGYVGLQSGAFFNTAAVSSIALTPSAGTISEFSTFALFGIRA